MEKNQFILQYIGEAKINNEYSVKIKKGEALQIDWFKGNDLTIDTQIGEFIYNEYNAEKISDNLYLIKIEKTEDIKDLPIRFERGDYLVAGNIVINNKTKEYYKADQIDILEDELVTTYNNKLVRILFSGDKVAVEQYIKT